MTPNRIELNDSDRLEMLICENEIEIAINSLNDDSSPGNDGRATEFYKTFVHVLKSDLAEQHSNCYFAKTMTHSMKKAVVKLICRKNDRQ